jgi:hypothetical protein
MPKYNGRFVVKDIANGRQYLADLLYQFELGDSLAGWTLGGTTSPTIAANGNMDFYQAGAGAGDSFAKRTIFTGGYNLAVLHQKVTLVVDNNISSGYAGMMDVGINGGMGFQINPAPSSIARFWLNNVSQGQLTFTGINMTPGQEYSFDFVMTPTYIYHLIDGVPFSGIYTGIKGNAPMSNTPLLAWMGQVRNISYYFTHSAGNGPLHYQIRDIKVGRLVGTGEA